VRGPGQVGGGGAGPAPGRSRRQVDVQQRDVRPQLLAGMDAIRWMCFAIGVLGVVLALSFLPGRTATAIDATEDEPAAMR
jgi:hypothetical protein